MKYLIYKSQANINQLDLFKLLQEARENNRRLNITGILVTHAKGFVQYIEGEDALIDQLFHDRIKKDKRHQDVTVVAEGVLNNKAYKDWDMGYLCLPDMHSLISLLEEEASAVQLRNFHQFVTNLLPMVETEAV